MFVGYKKNLNYRKHKTLKDEFLKSGLQADCIFADIDYLSKHVGKISSAKDISKIFKFIAKNLKQTNTSKDNEYRTAKQIWISGRVESPCELAVVFESIARQLDIPTIHLQMINANWKQTLANNGSLEKRDACECYINGKWVFVDPALQLIQEKYNHNKLSVYINDTVCSYQIFSKSTDLFETGATTKNLTTKTLQTLFKTKK